MRVMLLFSILCSLSDRKPVEDGDDIVVMLVPDYQMLEYVEKIASRLSDDPVLPNPSPNFFYHLLFHSSELYCTIM